LAEPGSPETLIAQSTATSCGEANGTVTLFLTGGTAPVQYSLNGVDFQSDSIFTLVPAGTYTATIRDSNNCALQKAVTVDSSSGISAAILINVPLRCFNDSTAELEANVSGGLAPYNIGWSNDTDAEVLNGISAGFYRLVVTDADGCEARDSVTLVNPRPVLVQITGPDSLCSGDSLRLASRVSGAQGAVQYNWQNALSIDSVLNWIPLASGPIELIVTDTQGCADTTEKTIVVLPLPSGIIAVDTAEACEPHCVTYTFVPSAAITLSSYEWISPESPSSFQDFLKVCYPLSGFYGVELLLTDIYGCSNQFSGDSLVRVNPLPFADFIVNPEKTDILRPKIVTDQLSTGADFFQWDFGDGDTSSLQAPVHIYRDTGLYQICLNVRTQFNCKDDTCKTVEIDAFPTFYAPNAFSPDGSGINDTFNLYFTYETIFRLEIYNRWGEMVFVSEDSKAGWDGTYSGKPAQSDVYTWKASFRNIFKQEFIVFGRVLLIR
jgi:gliding motility-associated-like protein